MPFDRGASRASRRRASPRSAYQPKSRRHIHPPRYGMRRPMEVAEIRLTRRRNKQRDEAGRPGAIEIRYAFRLKLAAPRQARLHAQRKLAADFHFRTAAK